MKNHLTTKNHLKESKNQKRLALFLTIIYVISLFITGAVPVYLFAKFIGINIFLPGVWEFFTHYYIVPLVIFVVLSIFIFLFTPKNKLN
jgi:phosphotransferase system  glucose/maltose/N-acetylglucosamine-specific IIC component